MQNFSIDLEAIVMVVVLLGLLTLFFALVGFLTFTLFRWRDRERVSVDSVLLQVAVSRNNETKIDAMEQLFASLFSVKKGGWKQKFNVQPTISFEIVARREEIRFYVWTPKSLTDLIEKQIHGAYPDAEIVEIQEYNLFNEEGKVAYKALQLRGENFKPVKTFKDP